jgi:hypothetical protein
VLRMIDSLTKKKQISIDWVNSVQDLNHDSGKKKSKKFCSVEHLSRHLNHMGFHGIQSLRLGSVQVGLLHFGPYYISNFHYSWGNGLLSWVKDLQNCVLRMIDSLTKKKQISINVIKLDWVNSVHESGKLT